MTQFSHQHAAHCESGVMANLMAHSGQPMTEAMAFGLSAGLSFAYLPFIKISGAPLIAYRMPPKAIIKGLTKAVGAKATFRTFRTVQAGQNALDSLLNQGQVAGLQTSVYWLPYFPLDMRFHFNAHNLVVYGKEGDDYLISDPVFEDTMRCATADLNRARFAKGVLAPKGLLYQLEGAGTAINSAMIVKAVRKTCKTMQAPVPIAGVKGIRMLARKVAQLNPADPKSALFVGHIVRMQEEIGTGGAGFRFLYAAFLQEASQFTGLGFLAQYADQLMSIGDEWRMFALKTARMVKGREPFVPATLAQCLHDLAERELAFFKALKVDVAHVAG
ncbi:MAG: BtrH N-terminal domain-containing protein [Formosimonas sp.]